MIWELYQRLRFYSFSGLCCCGGFAEIRWRMMRKSKSSRCRRSQRLHRAGSMGVLERKEIDVGDLTTNFSKDEFKCPCCGRSEMDLGVIAVLQRARTEAGIPFYINSGFRCVKHNKAVGGKSNSAHLLGRAVDIQATNSLKRYLIVLALLEAGFERIGVSKTFVHVDDSPEKSQGVMWLY